MDAQYSHDLLQYARFHGLSIDHLKDNPLEIRADVASSSDTVLDFADSGGLPTIEIPNGFPESEKVDLDEDGRRLLAWVLSCQNCPTEDYHVDVEQHRPHPRLESPLLRSDHELDMRDFARVDETIFDTAVFQPFVANEEKDGGLTWPIYCTSLTQKYDDEINAERLDIPRDARVFLKSIFVQDRETNLDAILAEELSSRHKFALEPTTPPLFSLTPQSLTPSPSSPIGPFSPLSEHTSPTAAEVLRLEEALSRVDRLDESHHGLGEEETEADGIIWSDFLEAEHLKTPTKGVPTVSSSPPLPRARAGDLKVEVPLTPPTSIEAPGPLSLVETLYVADLRNWDEEAHINSQDEFDAFFNDTIGPIAKAAEARVQQEQLVEADSTLRMKVPLLDFSVVEPPWEVRQSKTEAQKDLNETMLPIAKLGLHHWQGVSKLERELPWMPFPLALGHVEEEEGLVDVDLLERFTSSLEFADAVNIECLTWKPEGLRLLDDDDDEEELTPALMQDDNEVDILIKKRKLELPVISLPTRPVSQSSDQHQSNTMGKSHMLGIKDDKTKVEEKRNPSAIAPSSTAMEPSGMFSASGALQYFMDLQGHKAKRVKLTKSPSVLISASRALTAGPASQAQVVTKTSPTVPNATTQLPASFAVSFPGSIPLNSQRTCIFSSTIMKQRGLMREIVRFAPDLNIIERNLELKPILATDTREQAHDVLRDEADISISPSTGIICTTIQKIKQKSLPGQSSQSSTKVRIAKVAVRYERLLVLVAGNTLKAIDTLQDRDCQALLELMTFCLTTGDSVSVTFVHGGEEILAKWIVGLMSLTTITSYTLLQDETQWEIFLRRAGMNAFAAQVVLGELKTCNHEEVSSSSPAEVGFQHSLLPSLLQMTLPERLKGFGSILGGTKALLRASSIMDANWTLFRS